MSRRSRILKDNRRIREHRSRKPRRLEEGEVTFRIPVEDMKALQMLYPGLASGDPLEITAAFRALRHSPIGQKYLVQRTPRQVKNSPKGVIVK